MYRRKQLNPQRTKRPVKVGKKKRKIVDIDEECLPVWVRPAGNLPIHPEIDKQLAKPFLSSVYIDPLHGFRFPCGEGVQDAIMEGLHKRMRNRYFRGHKLPAIRRVTEGMLRLPSSKADGSRADDVLEECIRTGQAPPPPGKRGCSEYATAVWNWWREHHHRPVLAQLPVILPKFNVATAGDYFTIHTCPYTKRETLWLWELKTGWPVIPREPDIMSPPLAAIWLTPENRYHLQLLLTQMAYERELGMKIDNARVIQVWRERVGEVQEGQRVHYECKVQVKEPSELSPADWTIWTDKEVLYASLSAKTVKK